MGTYKNINGNLELIPGVTLFADNPIGSIIPFGGTTAPKGWFICQGQAISRTDYAALFAVIGTSFGAGDGSSTFNVPDLREATVKGAGLTGLSNNHMDADGLAVGEFTDDRIQQMTGEFEWRTAGDNNLCDIISNKSNVTGVFEKNVNSGQYYVIATSGGKYADGGNLVFDASNVARTGATTEVKSVGVNYIIKAKQVALPVDIESQVETVAAAAGETAGEAAVADALTANSNLFTAAFKNGLYGFNIGGSFFPLQSKIQLVPTYTNDFEVVGTGSTLTLSAAGTYTLSSGNYQYGRAISIERFNITDVKYITFLARISALNPAQGHVYIDKSNAVWTTNDNIENLITDGTFSQIVGTTTNTQITLDVRSFTGDYYIGWCSSGRTSNVDSIVLEY